MQLRKDSLMLLLPALAAGVLLGMSIRVGVSPAEAQAGPLPLEVFRPGQKISYAADPTLQAPSWRATVVDVYGGWVKLSGIGGGPGGYVFPAASPGRWN
jgi:hypothetical protein